MKIIRYEKQGNTAFEVRLWKFFYRTFIEIEWEFDKAIAIGIHNDRCELCLFGNTNEKIFALGWIKVDSGHMKKDGWEIVSEKGE